MHKTGCLDMDISGSTGCSDMKWKLTFKPHIVDSMLLLSVNQKGHRKIIHLSDTKITQIDRCSFFRV